MATLPTAGESGIRVEADCAELNGLSTKQKNICKKHIEIMDAVRVGALEALGECQNQFRARRWNCSTVDPARLFGNVLKSGTRETAFVYAISSAGVAHAVTRVCSSGTLSRCGCDRSVHGRSSEGFEWAGCSDNIAYGSAFARTFVDARENLKKKHVSNRALMNLHNNNAGRKAIEEHMKIQCKCHGVSGSCELKTCWRSMPSFRDVGSMLKDKFDSATEVEQRKIGSRLELVAKNEQFKPHTDSDLVYLDSSPDFCEPDPRTGSLGTQDRLCNKTSKAIDGCELMCCGRGFNTRRKTVIERCNCKFHWCCQVKCQRCRRDIEEYVCR